MVTDTERPQKVYDIALAWNCLIDEYFCSRIRELCGQFALSFFLVEPVWVEQFTEKLQRGEIGVRVLIDMASDCYYLDDQYYKLAQTVKASRGWVIDDPDVTPLATHKGKFHHVLSGNGIAVPETVIVKREEIESFRLTDAIKDRVGVPFVVKPGWGYGGQGVIVGATSEQDLLRSAEVAAWSDCFLIQRYIKPRELEDHIAWFRVFHTFGEVIPCWWEPPQGVYSMVTPLQKKLYSLEPLETIVKKIARLSKIDFFSTEIAIEENGRFVAVDYVNDECDMHLKSYYTSGVPDEVVRRIAWLLVSNSMQIIEKHPFEEELRARDLDWQAHHRPR